MSELKIILDFPKATTDLTGNRLGRKTFEEQVKPKIDGESKKVIVEFPETINDIGTSFIQGMYAFLSEKYGSDKALDKMTLWSEKQETNTKIQKVIDIYGI